MVETINAAIESLSASLPDASLRMRHGEAEGSVLSASSRDLSGDTVSSDTPQEMRRVIGRRCDFPSLAKGSAVVLADEWHIVTSCRTDPVGASLTVGLSAPLGLHLAEYRRPGTQIRQPLEVLAVESEVLDAPGAAFAPTSCRAWFVAFAAERWLETSDPQVSDELAIEETRLRVAAVAKRDGYWLLTCRARRRA